MANVHLFVDESKARGYRFALTTVDPQDMNAERTLVRDLLLKGQSHLHFTKESDGRRRKILDALARNSTARTTILTAPDGLKDKAARLRCLQGAADLAIEMRAARLVFEEDASTLQADRKHFTRFCAEPALSTALKRSAKSLCCGFPMPLPGASPRRGSGGSARSLVG